jgi:two-component system response regulator HydG
MPRIVVISNSKQKDVLQALKKSDVRLAETSYDECLTALGIEGADCAVICVNEDIANAEIVINNIKAFNDSVPVVVVGVGSLEDAVLMMKNGASDCLRYPLNQERLQIAVANAAKLYHLKKKVYLLENQMGWRGNLDNIIGHSSSMQEMFQTITTVSKSNATVLILGESGTGKELVAKAIHKHSPRSFQNFIDINCGAIPRELLENELFGHEKGSYTGADRRYIGCCERAHKGTLFLDEICEMDASLQVKILRLLQERSFSRVGGTELIHSDIRFIAATNKDIHEEVKKGNFREDLYYRLNVVPIILPPLRDRPEDIPLLAKHFLEKYCARNEKIFVDIEPSTMECLFNHKWPGNVRELENVIERVVVLHNDSHVKIKYLPPNLQKLAGVEKQHKPLPLTFTDGNKIIPLENVEKYAIEAALAKCMGSVAEASKQLKIGQATLYRKIKQYGLKT